MFQCRMVKGPKCSKVPCPSCTMFLRAYFSIVQYAQAFKFPRTYVSQVLRSQGLVLNMSYIPKVLCSKVLSWQGPMLLGHFPKIPTSPLQCSVNTQLPSYCFQVIFDHVQIIIYYLLDYLKKATDFQVSIFNFNKQTQHKSPSL